MPRHDSRLLKGAVVGEPVSLDRFGRSSSKMALRRSPRSSPLTSSTPCSCVLFVPRPGAGGRRGARCPGDRGGGCGRQHGHRVILGFISDAGVACVERVRMTPSRGSPVILPSSLAAINISRCDVGVVGFDRGQRFCQASGAVSSCRMCSGYRPLRTSSRLTSSSTCRSATRKATHSLGRWLARSS